MCPSPPKPLGILTLCKSWKGKPVLCTMGKQPRCPSTSLFLLPLLSLGRARSIEGTRPGLEGLPPGEEFGQVLQYEGGQTSQLRPRAGLRHSVQMLTLSPK